MIRPNQSREDQSEVLEGEEEGTKVGKYLGSLIGSEK